MIHQLFDMTGQTALVTGGGTGLGQGFARVLAAAGAKVIVCARRKDKLENTVKRIVEDGGEAYSLAMDITQGDSVKECVGQANAISPVTVLVNNAGIGSDKLLKDLPEEAWDTVSNTNLKGSWLVAREVALGMIARGDGGSIINIASVLADCVQMGTGAYSTAKAGLVHLTRSMAYEWARYGIRVNALSPGYYKTELAGEFLASDYGQKLTRRIPRGRLGTGNDLDGAILLLASRASAYMTGSVITVDGGLSLSTI